MKHGYQIAGNVTKRRDPTDEERAAGITDVIEGLELVSVSLVDRCPYCGGFGRPIDCDICQFNRKALEGVKDE